MAAPAPAPATPQFSVIVDTCSLARPLGGAHPGRDPHLENAGAQLLLGAALPAGHPVCVPEIVVREMVKHYREDLTKAINEVARHLHRAAELVRLPVGLPAELTDLDAAVAGYERWLRDYLVQVKRCTILPIPQSARDGLQLLERDLASRRPFNTAGRGMRDTVLWLGVLEWLEQSATSAALITANVADFCKDKDSAGQLHPDLLDDLSNRGWDGRVEHFASIESFAEAHIKPVVERLETLRAELEQGTHPTVNLRRAVFETVGPFLAAEPVEAVAMGISRPRGAQLTLEGVGVRELHIGDVYRVGADQYYVGGTAVLEERLRLVVLRTDVVGTDGAIATYGLGHTVHAINRTVQFSLVIGPHGASGITVEGIGPPE